MNVLIWLTVVLGGAAIYVMLPSRHAQLRRWGRAFGVPAIAFLALLWAGRLGGFGVTLHFYLLGLTAVVSGVMTITARKPIHSAVWFGLVLLSTAGLYLLIGAQFLAAASVVVYAGAILVTLLFVVMLAQQTGLAPYDRLAREPGLATLVGTIIGLSLIATVLEAQRVERLVVPAAEAAKPAVEVPSRSVANLGATLFTEHLISIEVAGTLLLVALVGAVCIARRDRRAKE